MSDDRQPPTERGTVRFDPPDILIMIVHLANAVTNLNTATSLLAADDKPGTHQFLAKSGEQVDAILTLMRSKLGEEVVPL